MPYTKKHKPKPIALKCLNCLRYIKVYKKAQRFCFSCRLNPFANHKLSKIKFMEGFKNV